MRQSLKSPPAITNKGWVRSSFSPKEYSEMVSFTFSSSGEGSKTVYVWFKDEEGNVSNSTKASISYSLGHDRLVWPDTGQTTSYTNTFGEDHDYTIKAPSYTDNTDGTITDNITGLIWQKEDDNTSYSNLDRAGIYCDNLELGGQKDWRLPHIKELLTIVNAVNGNPAIDTTYFIGTKGKSYWASVNKDGISGSVDFYSGRMSYNADGTYVRCLRGGL
ncbi:MAG: DUF1566 domain-containing protein [SAR324 cluster bacterium]|nr:DUF1566 domain-containing protein [SAR324 cluster bacterium]